MRRRPARAYWPTAMLTVAMLLAGACAAPTAIRQEDTIQQHTMQQGNVPVAPGIALQLPGPEALGRSTEATQLVLARHGGQKFAFEIRISVDPRRVLVVGTDTLGREAMRIVWDGSRLDVERAPWLPASLRPENVLADIMLVYWPSAALRQAMATAGAGATVTSSERGRSVIVKGNEMISIAYTGDPWSGEARLANRAWRYDLVIRSAVVSQ